MPLLKNQLVDGIKNVFKQQIQDVNRVADELARAYGSYASSGMGPNGDPVILTGLEQTKLKTAFLSMMKARMPAPAAASTIAQGVLAFWLAPPDEMECYQF